MTHRVEFRSDAIDQVAEFAKADPDGIRALLDRLDLLAGEPRPAGAFAYRPDHLRIHVGFYRVLIQVEDEISRVLVAHVGRAGS
ncbi:type II toxin-antitoxin system RelE family toxin [Actinospica robiniae]|uniref:type II toxin-antitoxin system RelE family toxin n=1 Tax=Actinospica robiniae TaxID=304901 RepID=UPI00041E88B3|nr:hypothetical protein [Actinospica robiniae]